MTLTESFAIRDSAGWSRRVNSLLEDFEARRRQARESAEIALVEEGHNASSVADAFGTTRQWTSRLLTAAQTAPEATVPTTSSG